VWLNHPAEEVFGWHVRPGAFERLTPPWTRVEVTDRTGGLEDGGQVVLSVHIGPFRKRWTLEHSDYVENRQFCNEQVAGPFRFWKHSHRLVPEGPHSCYLEDHIEYGMPLGFPGDALGGWAVRKALDRLFGYRHRVLVQDLRTHLKYRQSDPLRILVTGSSGLVGAALTSFLSTGGHTVLRLVRSRSEDGPFAVYWDPSGILDASRLEGLDAAVHLAGESIAQGHWTEEKKQRIRESRVEGTRLLCETMACLRTPPRVLVCASALGYYGDRGDALLTEDDPPGSGFLAEVCQAWEAATGVASRNGIRVVNLRLGMVLTPAGGALARMLPPFRLGLGGRLGSGDQYVSWISLEDAVGAIHHAVMTPGLSGAVNCVTPRPVTNSELTKSLGRVLRRPAVLRVPAPVLRRRFGELADTLLLGSTRATPAALTASGYQFRQRDLDLALHQMLGR